MFKKNKKQTEISKKKGAYCQGRHYYKKNRDCVVGGAYRKRELWGV